MADQDTKRRRYIITNEDDEYDENGFDPEAEEIRTVAYAEEADDNSEVDSNPDVYNDQPDEDEEEGEDLDEHWLT